MFFVPFHGTSLSLLQQVPAPELELVWPYQVLSLGAARTFQGNRSHRGPHGGRAFSSPNLKRVDDPQSEHHPGFFIPAQAGMILTAS